MRLNNFKLLLLIPLLGTFIACSDNKDPETPPLPPPNPDTEEKFEELISQMEEIKDVNTFTAMFKSLDTKNWDEVEDLTIFAFTDKAVTRAGQSSALSQEVMERHILKGKYTLAELKKHDVLYSINKSPLKISTDDNGNVSVNGIKLKSGSSEGIYAIFTIDEVFPDIDIPQQKEYVFKVYQYRDHNGDGILQKEVVENAEVVLYDKDMDIVRKLYTDAGGIASLGGFSGNIAGYIVTHEDKNLSNIYDGWLVVGVFENQEQIDNYVDYAGMEKNIGGPMLADMSGDGVIDDRDKTAMAYFDEEVSLIEVFVVKKPLSVVEPERPELDDVINACNLQFIELQNLYEKINLELVTLEQRIKINSTDKRVEDFFINSYQLIRTVNFLNDAEEIYSNFEEYIEEVYICRSYRSLAYHYLTRLFGEVPLIIDHKVYPDELPSANTVQELNDYIEHGLQSAIDNIAKKNQTFMVEDIVIFYLGLEKYEKARYFCEYIHDGDISVTDFLYLYRAEISRKLGNIDEATNWVNQYNYNNGLPYHTNQNTILEYIQSKIDSHPIINNLRWGVMNNWEEKYRLLPIPQIEINRNPKLKQNPGW